MNLFDFFRGRQKQTSASVAKERLQIIVAHERGQRSEPDYLPALQKELLEVIRKYVNIGNDDVHIELETRQLLDPGTEHHLAGSLIRS